MVVKWTILSVKSKQFSNKFYLFYNKYVTKWAKKKWRCVCLQALHFCPLGLCEKHLYFVCKRVLVCWNGATALVQDKHTPGCHNLFVFLKSNIYFLEILQISSADKKSSILTAPYLFKYFARLLHSSIATFSYSEESLIS